MKINSSFVLWVSLLLSYSCMGDFSYNFYQGTNKTSMFGSGTPPNVTFNGDLIRCKCGKVPASILVVDDEVEAFCSYHQDKIVDAYEEMFIKKEPVVSDYDEAMILPRSTQSSRHRKFDAE